MIPDDAPDDLLLSPLDDFFAPRPEGKSLSRAIRPDGLVAGSCGPLSMRPEHLVGYGFLAPEGDRRGRWQFSPEQPFRATKIYAWGWKGETASISSLLFGSDEQLVDDHPAPADLFASWVSPKQFLELYGGVENPAAGNHRVLCKHLPGQMSFMVPLHLPTLLIGESFEVSWTGPLTAFFVCGRELLPEKSRGQTANSSQQTAQRDPDPDPNPGRASTVRNEPLQVAAPSPKPQADAGNQEKDFDMRNVPTPSRQSP